jgi:glucokinase
MSRISLNPSYGLQILEQYALFCTILLEQIAGRRCRIAMGTLLQLAAKEHRRDVAHGKTLLGDIGGTTARFAVLAGDALGPVNHLPVSQYRSLIDAIRDYLGSHGERAPIDAAMLAVAGPIESGRGVLINSQWVIDAAELQAAFGFKPVHLINDFEAVAHALPHLRGSDVRPIDGGKPPLGETMAVLGPGTGLGMAGLVRSGERTAVIPTEGGHTTLPGATPREDAVIAHLRKRFGHASAERALSGPGLENLHAAIAAIDGIVIPERTAADITQHALDRDCPLCVEAADMFCAMLGTVAGNLALMFRARGGVYIAGGIAPRIVDVLVRSEFRARFAAKGRFRSYLERIPVAVIVNPDPAFIGLKALALQLSEQK